MEDDSEDMTLVIFIYLYNAELVILEIILDTE